MSFLSQTTSVNNPHHCNADLRLYCFPGCGGRYGHSSIRGQLLMMFGITVQQRCTAYSSEDDVKCDDTYTATNESTINRLITVEDCYVSQSAAVTMRLLRVFLFRAWHLRAFISCNNRCDQRIGFILHRRQQTLSWQLLQRSFFTMLAGQV